MDLPLVANAIYGRRAWKSIFFGEGLTWNFDVSVLVWIGIMSMIIILGIALQRKSVIAENTEQKQQHNDWISNKA